MSKLFVRRRQRTRIHVFLILIVRKQMYVAKSDWSLYRGHLITIRCTIQPYATDKWFSVEMFNLYECRGHTLFCTVGHRRSFGRSYTSYHILSSRVVAYRPSCQQYVSDVSISVLVGENSVLDFKNKKRSTTKDGKNFRKSRIPFAALIYKSHYRRTHMSWRVVDEP